MSWLRDATGATTEATTGHQIRGPLPSPWIPTIRKYPTGVSNAATAQLDIHPISRSNKQLKHVKTTFLEISQQVSPSYPHDLAIWFSQLGFMMVKPL